jgi:programmed cell death protein 5
MPLARLLEAAAPKALPNNASPCRTPIERPPPDDPNLPAVARIALVKPDKARNVENMILAAAQRGAITEKVSEERLRSMLEQLSERDSKASKITIQRRRPAFDEDD